MNVLVTGGSRGIGRAVALAFAKDGHCVMVNFKQQKEKAESVVQEIINQGGQANLIQGDISQKTDVEKIIRKVLDVWGCLDGVVNNASIVRDKTILKMTETQWREVMDVNLTGTFFCLQEAAKFMAKKKNGFIINIASILGVKGAIGCANYVASKAGVIALTKAAAQELGRFNIRVNAVLPGYHPTDMGETILEKRLEKIKEEHSLGRFSNMNDLTDFIVSLSGKTSVSGQIFNIDSRVL